MRNVRIGRRVRHGAGYELSAADAADYLVAIDFDDVVGLQAYLRHPAHDELGRRFDASLSAALVYDFEVGGSGAARGRDGLPCRSVRLDETNVTRLRQKELPSMIARSCVSESALLMAVRRCDPLSSPLVYQEPARAAC